MATVLLVRHGETDWNRDGLLQGWAPVSLNDRGREQARSLGTHLAETYAIDGVVASDLRRTRETAALLDEAGGPTPTFDRDWRERGFGVFQGLGYEAVFSEHPEYDVTNGAMDAIDARPENGESLLDLRRRVLRGWASVLRRVGIDAGIDADLEAGTTSAANRNHRTSDDDTVLVVTHGGPIYVLLAHLDGVSLPEAFDGERQANCAVNEVRVAPTDSGTDPRTEIVRRNDTSHRED